MLIKIKYESKYSLSTKTETGCLKSMGELKEVRPEDKNIKEIIVSENSYLENIKEINKYYTNFKYADITQNTILGILCRLVGEVRRLDMLPPEHLIMSLKDKISFTNCTTSFQNEIVQLHTEEKLVMNNAGGLIKKEHFLLNNNPLSETLLNIFLIKDGQDIQNLLKRMEINDASLAHDVYGKNINIMTFLNEYRNMAEKDRYDKLIENVNISFKENNQLMTLVNIASRLIVGKPEHIQEFRKNYPEEIFKKIDLDKHQLTEIYHIGSWLFTKKIQWLLEQKYYKDDLEKGLNSKKTIKGIAPKTGTLTIREFYANFIDKNKTITTMPYFVDVNYNFFEKKDVYKVFNPYARLGITKESGELHIQIDIDYEKSVELKKHIYEAGVNTFHLGKKGLAYIDKIEM